jgi:hypothetical protein
MKKPDDLGLTFREMSVVPRHVEQLAKTDYGPLVRAKIGRRPIKIPASLLLKTGS